MTISHHDTTLSIPSSTPNARPERTPLGDLSARLLATDAAPAPAVARVALALVLFPHGAQHALGWFGGYGFSGTLGWMTGTLGFPAPLAALGIVTELLAPVALLAGIGGRVAAGLLVVHMAFAAATHVKNGFFMNWFGSMPTGEEGFEYHLLAMALAAVVVLAGSGAVSLDRRLARRSEGR
jgi:putative oxidoreductase